MAKNLIWRNLPDEVNEAFDSYKQIHGVANNTDAARGMIEAYFPLSDELTTCRDKLKESNFRLEYIIRLLREKEKIDQSIQSFLSKYD